MVLQCLLSSVPLLLGGNWTIPLVTLMGTILALCDGSLKQWRSEKWSARGKSKKRIALSGGNGSQHAMILLATGTAYDLEDLASPRTTTVPLTRRLLALFAVLRIILLIIVTCITADIWYLFIIGSMGMVHNVIAAGAARDSRTQGLYLSKIKQFEGPRVMKVLQELESDYPLAGASLLKIYFPGALRPAEELFWTNKLKGFKKTPPSQRSVSV